MVLRPWTESATGFPGQSYLHAEGSEFLVRGGAGGPENNLGMHLRRGGVGPSAAAKERGHEQEGQQTCDLHAGPPDLFHGSSSQEAGRPSSHSGNGS